MLTPLIRPATNHRLPFRADIEGLRGWLAAVIVIYHLFAVPIGGIVGVDVFFVISGFLITGLLLREVRSTGRISISAFYARRARRILPVALVALVVTVAASPFVWFAPRAVRIALDGFAALTFVENWHLIASQRSYLQHDAGVSPLQHYWSLAVEEQFYVAWPLVVIAVCLLVVRLQRPGRLTAVLLAVSSIGFLASALFSAWQTNTDIDAAYFDTFARAWEFVPGIIAALLSDRLVRAPRQLRVFAVWAGIVSIVVACCLVDPHVAFPWPRALFATVGTALIVGFGTGTEGAATRLLAVKPARWLGRRSYSLYLWHFPVAVMIPAVLGRAWWALGVTLVVTLLLSAASYRWIERPALRSSWLRRLERPPGDRRRDRVRRGTREVVGVGVIAAVIVGAATAQVASPTRLGDPTFIAGAFGLPHVGTETPRQLSERELREGIAAGLAATSWPADLTPSLDLAFGNALSPAFDIGTGCRNDPGKKASPQTCLWNADGTRTAYLIGDSTAAAWAGAVTEALVPKGWRVEAVAYSGCSPLAVESPVVSADSPTSAACNRARSQTLRLLEAARPELVIVSSGVNSYTEARETEGERAAGRAWKAGAQRTTSELLGVADRVAVLENPPAGESVVDCATRTGSPADCQTTLTADHREMNAAVAAGVRAAEAEATGDETGSGEAAGSAPARQRAPAKFIPTHEWFCAADGRCPIVIGSMLVRPDRSHVSDVLATSLGQLLRNRLTP